jgi:hypothetical protein
MPGGDVVFYQMRLIVTFWVNRKIKLLDQDFLTISDNGETIGQRNNKTTQSNNTTTGGAFEHRLVEGTLFSKGKIIIKKIHFYFIKLFQSHLNCLLALAIP